MKSLIVVFAFVCIAGALAGLTDEQKAKLREYRVDCVAETGVGDDVIEKAKRGELVAFDEKLDCFSACMLKKVKIMRPDGTIDEQVARAKMPTDLPHDDVDEVINRCKVQAGKDICEIGGKIVSCLAKTTAAYLFH